MADQVSAVPAAGTETAMETVLAFVNTRHDNVGRIERFGDAGDFAAWAAEQGLIGEETVSESEAAAARELRAALVTVMLAHTGHPDVTSEQIADAERHLDHAGSLYPVRVRLSTSGSSVTGQNRGAAGVFGNVLAAAHEVAQQGAWGRMKGCCSQPCEHGFIDHTKNGSQRFCGSKCASRAAMRAMRERRRDGGAE